MQSILMYKQQEQDYERCATSLANYKEQPVCRDSTTDFVLIIGESFNRHMSNLYDGRWDTNPLLIERKKQGRLFLFDDVTATSNGTSVVFQYLLSMNSRRDKNAWYEERSDVTIDNALLWMECYLLWQPIRGEQSA